MDTTEQLTLTYFDSAVSSLKKEKGCAELFFLNSQSNGYGVERMPKFHAQKYHQWGISSEGFPPLVVLGIVPGLLILSLVFQVLQKRKKSVSFSLFIFAFAFRFLKKPIYPFVWLS